MNQLERLINYGSIQFSLFNKIVILTFEPNENIAITNRTASVLIRRFTAQDCLDTLEYYLLKDERDILDIPTTFFDPFFQDEDFNIKKYF